MGCGTRLHRVAREGYLALEASTFIAAVQARHSVLLRAIGVGLARELLPLVGHGANVVTLAPRFDGCAIRRLEHMRCLSVKVARRTARRAL